MIYDNFIKLTAIGGDEIYISYPGILTMKKVQDVTMLCLFGGQNISVKESITQIKDLIKKTNQFTLKTETK